MADTYYNIGLLYKSAQRFAESFHSFYLAMEIYKRLSTKNSSKQKNYDNALYQLRDIYKHFKESDRIPKECEADVKKIKQMLEE